LRLKEKGRFVDRLTFPILVFLMLRRVPVLR